jgi:hypothetical protein
MEKRRNEKGQFVKGNNEGHRWEKGKSGNPNGRVPKMQSALKNIPADAKEKVHDALWTAISQPDIKTATAYLMKTAEELPECGFVLQLAIKSLNNEIRGWFALMDICDRLFGKPRQIAEIEGNFNLTPPPIIIEGEEE